MSSAVAAASRGMPVDNEQRVEELKARALVDAALSGDAVSAPEPQVLEVPEATFLSGLEDAVRPRGRLGAKVHAGGAHASAAKARLSGAGGSGSSGIAGSGEGDAQLSKLQGDLGSGSDDVDVDDDGSGLDDDNAACGAGGGASGNPNSASNSSMKQTWLTVLQTLQDGGTPNQTDGAGVETPMDVTTMTGGCRSTGPNMITSTMPAMVMAGNGKDRPNAMQMAGPPTSFNHDMTSPIPNHLLRPGGLSTGASGSK